MTTTKDTVERQTFAALHTAAGGEWSAGVVAGIDRYLRVLSDQVRRERDVAGAKFLEDAAVLLTLAIRNREWADARAGAPAT